MIVVTERPFKAVKKDVLPMIEDHWKECGEVAGYPTLHLDVAMYELLEKVNQHVGLAAYYIPDTYTGNTTAELIGYCSVFILKHPHHKNVKYGNVDGIYIKPEYRGGEAVFHLMTELELSVSKRKGYCIRFPSNVNTPIGKLLKRFGYVPAEEIYSKVIGD